MKLRLMFRSKFLCGCIVSEFCFAKLLLDCIVSALLCLVELPMIRFSNQESPGVCPRLPRIPPLSFAIPAFLTFFPPGSNCSRGSKAVNNIHRFYQHYYKMEVQQNPLIGTENQKLITNSITSSLWISWGDLHCGLVHYSLLWQFINLK